MLKPTRSARTNYRSLAPFLRAADDAGGYRKFYAGGYMPLSVENLGYTFHGLPVYALAYYGEQNGDLMADPDITVAVDHAAGTVDPLTFQNDYLGRYSQVYSTDDSGRELYRPGLRADLDSFLRQWAQNLCDQGFRADAPSEAV